MKIETKFDIHQEVYYIAEYINGNGDSFKEVTMGDITSIRLSEDINKKATIYYWIDGYTYTENQLFATREEAEKKLKELDKIC